MRIFHLLIVLLCLLSTLVFSDLTERDIAIFTGLLGESEARQNEKLTKSLAESEARQNEKLTKSLAESEARQNVKLDKFEKSLTDVVKGGFQDLHSFSRRRVQILTRITTRVLIENNVFIGTGHTLLRNGKLAIIFTPHIKINYNITSLYTNVLLHPEYDFAIITSCPADTKYALDVTSYAVPELGDGLIVYGHGNTASVWKGIMSRVAKVPYAANCSLVPAQHWSGDTRICDGEYIAQGHQHEGMSGSAVLNGCGYVGMAHAVDRPDETKLASFAAIVRSEDIVSFMDSHADKLPTLGDCGMQAVLPPVARFVDCLVQPFPLCMTGSCENDNLNL